MKIIYNSVENLEAKQEITCNRCKSILEITPEDLGQLHGDYRDGDYYTISCPVCNDIIYVYASVLNKDMKIGKFALKRSK